MALIIQTFTVITHHYICPDYNRCPKMYNNYSIYNISVRESVVQHYHLGNECVSSECHNNDLDSQIYDFLRACDDLYKMAY